MRYVENPVLDVETLDWLPRKWETYEGPIIEARGAASAAKKQLGITNEIGSEEQAQQKKLAGTLIPGYTSLMDTGYLSPEEEAAATTSEMGAATAPFKSAEFQAANRAGATRNASDLTAQQDQLAIEEGTTAGQTAADLQRQKMANQQAGMYGLGQEQQLAASEAESMYGMAPATINAWSNAQASNPWLNLGNTIIGAAGQVGAAAAGKPG